jgi:putative addiction module component (TIGR02574 family)
VLEYALQLPVSDRFKFATRLIDSVDESDDIEISPAWQQEFDRRVESIRNGTAKLIPHEEVMVDLHRKLDE